MVNNKTIIFSGRGFGANFSLNISTLVFHSISTSNFRLYLFDTVLQIKVSVSVEL
jgi:hypothetical protein